MSHPPTPHASHPARRFVVLFGIGCVAGTLFFFGKRAWSQYAAEEPGGWRGDSERVTGEGTDGVDLFSPLATDAIPNRVDPRAKRGKRAADAFPHLMNASECLMHERYADAFRGYARASALAPDDPRPYFGLGEVYRGLDRNDLAARAYRKAVQLDSDYVEGKIKLAHVLCLLGENEEAVAHLRDVARKRPDEPVVLAQLASNTMRLGSPEKAAALLKKYNAMAGRQAWGYANLGRAYALAGHAAPAERWYRAALDIDAKWSLAYLWLGQLLVARGDRAEAESALTTFRRLQDLETKERRLQRALLRQADDVQVLANLALVRHMLGKNQKALIPLLRAIALQPDAPELRELEKRIKMALVTSSPP